MLVIGRSEFVVIQWEGNDAGTKPTGTGVEITKWTMTGLTGLTEREITEDGVTNLMRYLAGTEGLCILIDGLGKGKEIRVSHKRKPPMNLPLLPRPPLVQFWALFHDVSGRHLLPAAALVGVCPANSM